MPAQPAPPTVDLTEFYKLSRPKKKPCPLGFIRPQLASPDQANLDAAITTEIITAGAVQAWLAARGHDTSVSAVVAHRKHTCTCGDDT